MSSHCIAARAGLFQSITSGVFSYVMKWCWVENIQICGIIEPKTWKDNYFHVFDSITEMYCDDLWYKKLWLIFQSRGQNKKHEAVKKKKSTWRMEVGGWWRLKNLNSLYSQELCIQEKSYSVCNTILELKIKQQPEHSEEHCTLTFSVMVTPAFFKWDKSLVVKFFKESYILHLF